MVVRGYAASWAECVFGLLEVEARPFPWWFWPAHLMVRITVDRRSKIKEIEAESGARINVQKETNVVTVNGEAAQVCGRVANLHGGPAGKIRPVPSL